MRLAVITQAVDADDPLLGATVPKLKALAARVDELVVVAGRLGRHDLPPEVRVRSFEASGKVTRGRRYAAAVGPLLARRRVDAVLVHMSPIYLVLAAPLALPARVPLLLWYTHPHASPTLRVAAALAARRLTADESSFPRAARADAIGHGIDVNAFACAGLRPERPLDVLALGRYGAVKGYPVVLRAVRRALDEGVRLTLTVHGPVSNEAERRHRAELEHLRDELGLGERVVLGDALTAVAARERLAAADVLVSATRAGSADKAVLEACASCVPPLASTWRSLLPERLRFEAGDEAGLAARLGELAELDGAERERLGRELRSSVVERHSVERWADAVVRAACEAAA
jgi:glycosyltransferase involved in cell wall biosynthesis